MVYVYLIESTLHPEQRYVGTTLDLRKRLTDHNAGRSPHTAKFKPWRLVLYLGFADETAAHAFERYLKSGSGRTFLKRHFLRPPSAPYDAHHAANAFDHRRFLTKLSAHPRP